jgi:hypothetical protein
MGQAGVGSDKLISEMRVSKNGWLEDGSSKLVDTISQRINWITGLQVTPSRNFTTGDHHKINISQK